MRIEEVLKELRKSMTIILVTNLVQQARRLADRTMFLWNGEIIEIDATDVIFSDTPRGPADLRLRQRHFRIRNEHLNIQRWNTQHPVARRCRATALLGVGWWMLDVGCWLLLPRMSDPARRTSRPRSPAAT